MLPKNWDKSFEKEIYEEWKKSKLYSFKKSKEGKTFVIDTPPPYVNAPIHMGHAATYTLMDMFARFHRMKGFSVVFPFGLDRNGLPIEVAAEKKFGVNPAKTGREEFLAHCRKILEETSADSADSFLKLGISFNSWSTGEKIGDAYETDSVDYRILTQATFIELWNKGMVYEDTRLNTYCPGCRTTIADNEVDYKEMQTFLNHVIFKIKETGEDVIIATTRPELLCTAGMVIYNPQDERYGHLENKTAIVPIYGLEIPIKAHPMADPSFGTGMVFMSKSAGDQNAVRFLREMGIEAVSAINEEGKMNMRSGFLEGMHAKEARETIIKKLQEDGFLVKQEQIMHRTPICERSKHVIEYVSMPELYLKQTEFLDDLRKMADKINFYEPSSKQFLLDWINGISMDWAISRRRYYATEIPLWYCQSCGARILGEKGKYVQPWRERKLCECGAVAVGETRVFDTWFDSSNSPFYIMKWSSEQTEGRQSDSFYMSNKPCSLRPQGKEIVRTWLYYTLLKTYLLTGEQAFKDAWIHFHIIDEKGKKMSKSVGNVINPHEILDKYGAEPFRLWCAVEGNLAEGDLRCSFQRIEGAGKTINKLWNVAKFVEMISENKNIKKPKHLIPTDEWVINELNSLVLLADESYEKYDFYRPAVAIKHFLWETFASHYIEMAKNRAYNTGWTDANGVTQHTFSDDEQMSALYTLNHCIDIIMKLLAPVTPYITEIIYKNFRGKNIHEEKFPVAAKILKQPFTKEQINELNSAIWKAKKDNGMSLKAEVQKLTIPELFRNMEKDLKACHNAKEIVFEDKIEIIL
ncbi:MAG: valine--tRNA ligase [Candidatus Aenigmarchaeota archaeon]|nr:valine--tRNA ligase [Candidatus Aenigmarchaeota archaeon]